MLKYRLLDILACPICKRFPLRLFIFQESRPQSPSRVPGQTCEEYCGLLQRMIDGDGGDCSVCFSREVSEGLLVCDRCGRWYPIIDEIPHMLPDELREAEEDLQFLRRWGNEVPEEVLREGKPFNLSPQ